jgi:1-pyrroline-5-carboxylate dehydrogenase
MTTAERDFKVTYATLSSPSPKLHEMFDEAVERAKAQMGQTFPMLIDGEEVWSDETFTNRSPVDRDLVLGSFQMGTEEHVNQAVAAARRAFAEWGRKPWQERVALMRKAADTISDRLFDIAAVMTLEVGKNRLESLGDVEETADLIRYYCDQMEANEGFVVPMESESERHHNRSVLKPYGVWAVISPFNFPFALAGGPSGGALVAGNTVVFKPASDTAYTGWLLAECFRDAGLPAGVFNFITGGGRQVGQPLVDHPDINGITFTGSYDVGMNIYRSFAHGKYPRPCIAEMGGKNPVIISKKADLDKAAMGVMRSAFGLQGQKCSANSRVFVHEDVKDEFMQKLVSLTEKINVGDPTKQENWMGPVVNQGAYDDYQRFVADLREHGKIVHGGETIDELNGFYVKPTIVDELPADHELWQHEMFLPIVTVMGFDDMEEAMRKANEVDYGLTAGFYGEDDEEVQWFLDNIEAGVVYVNREAGATTGAWPGYQPFGGWKGSGSTGKAGGGRYYVQQYMHEQSQTVVE